MMNEIRMNVGEVNQFVSRINTHGDSINKGLDSYLTALDNAISYLGGSLVQPLTNASESVRKTRTNLNQIIQQYSETLSKNVSQTQTIDSEGAQSIGQALNKFY